MPSLIPQYLDEHAEHTPDSVALRYEGELLRYSELARRANRLAHALRANGVKRGDRVGIYLPRSLELGVSVYGIMKAGAAYVPVDPTAPAARRASRGPVSS